MHSNPKKWAAQAAAGWLVMEKNFWIQPESPDGDALDVRDTCPVVWLGRFMSLMRDPRSTSPYTYRYRWIDKKYEYPSCPGSWSHKIGTLWFFICTWSDLCLHHATQTGIARGAQQLHFNLDVFKAILFQWVYINNISFRVVEQPTFRLILGYLMACVSLSCLSQYLCTARAFKYCYLLKL